MRYRWRIGSMLGATLVTTGFLVGCSAAPTPALDSVPDDYTGTWSRVAGTDSKFSLRRVSDGSYRFRWVVDQGARNVRCDEVNRCIEFHEHSKIYEWTFVLTRAEEDGHLYIERQGTPILQGLTPLSEVDRLELQPGGQELWAYTIERNGEQLESPTGPYKYVLLSPDPF